MGLSRNILFDRNISNIHNSILAGYILPESNGYLLGLVLSRYTPPLKDRFSNTYLVKIDFQGNILWDLIAPFTSDETRGIVKDIEGNYYGICTSGNFIKVNNSFEEYEGNLMAFKFNNEGIIWERAFRAGSPSEFAKATNIFISHDSLGLVFAGHQINSEITTCSGVIGMVDFDGDSLWMREFEFLEDSISNEYNFVLDFQKTNDGYILGGETRSLPPNVFQSGWLVKVDQYGCLIPGCQNVNTIDVVNGEISEISVFPNPVSNTIYFRIEGKNEVDYQIIISDLSGSIKLQKSNIRAGKTYIVNCENWSKGIYLLSLKTYSGNYYSQKIIKQ
ncbi:MAG: T9SS type A sorting domain-containing protein [Saprospiraceae bacterium]